MKSDILLTYPQYPIEHDLHMKFPKGINTIQGNSKTHILKLIINIYIQKQSGRTWNKYFIDKIITIIFHLSEIDTFVFFHGHTIFACYMDEVIFRYHRKKGIDEDI